MYLSRLTVWKGYTTRSVWSCLTANADTHHYVLQYAATALVLGKCWVADGNRGQCGLISSFRVVVGAKYVAYSLPIPMVAFSV